MSYNICICVKAEGCDVYPAIAVPGFSKPDLKFEKVFRKTMDWDFTQKEEDSGKPKIYPCVLAIKKLDRGLSELNTNWKEYTKYVSGPQMSQIADAYRYLSSLKDCILKTSQEIPLQYLYMHW